MTDAYHDEGPFSFGVHASTGRPLDAGPGCLDIKLMLETEKRAQDAIGGPVPELDCYNVPFGFDPDNLADVGWGIIFAAGVDAAPYLEAMKELVDLRREQAGSKFRIFSNGCGYHVGESASHWLNNNGSSLNIIDPDDGVPYYLAIVGPPSEIPFEFQYSLDIVAAVGRLDFPSLDELTAYAHSVVCFENNPNHMTKRRIELFATCHDFDRATQLFTKQVAVPLANGTGIKGPLGAKYGFSVNSYVNELSTKQALTHILSNGDCPPSILFTGTHGMAFGADDIRHAENQGALVCQDWPGYGAISPEHWFAACDVPENANVHGLIHFFFACYGAGTPEFDNFQFQSQQTRIGPRAITARLPQKLMARPGGGVLASLGHVDRAWASSFQTKRGVAQTQGFRDVLDRLMAGQRVGHATDQFNNQWGVIGTELAGLLQDKAYGKSVRDADVIALQIARDDCRNYVVLGDPAVKLRPEPVAL